MCLPSPTVAQGQNSPKRLSLMRSSLPNNQQEITYTIHNPADVNRVKTRGKNIHTLHFFPSIPARNKEQSENRGTHPPESPLLRPRRASPGQVPRSKLLMATANLSCCQQWHKGLSCCTQAASSTACNNQGTGAPQQETFSTTPTQFEWFSKHSSQGFCAR